MKITIDGTKLDTDYIYQTDTKELVKIKSINYDNKTIKIKRINDTSKSIKLKENGIYKTNMGELIKIKYIKGDIIKVFNISDVCHVWYNISEIIKYKKIVEQII